MSQGRTLRRVLVTGVGTISPLGDTAEAVHGALCRGESGLGAVELFATAGQGPGQAGEVRDFDGRRYLGAGNLRPLDRTARLAAVAAQGALAASGWSPEMRGEREVGLVLGTMFGSVHTISEFDRRALTAGPAYVKPLDFANSVLNAAAGQTAIWHGLRGVNSTVAGGTTAGVQALGYGADLVRSGRSEAVLAGGAEELCFESYYGFLRGGFLAGGSNGTGPRSVPFGAGRNGFTLGEGAALVMLEEAGAALARGAPVLAEIRGHGTAYDPSRGTDPEAAAGALARAVRLALADAGVDAGEVDAVSASASGAVAGDRAEALGLGRVFGDRASELPVTAVKGALGESLGAAGALQATVLIQTMATGRLPGILGLDEMEDGLPLAGASAQARELAVRCGLVTAMGLDGGASALILAPPPVDTAPEREAG